MLLGNSSFDGDQLKTAEQTHIDALNSRKMKVKCVNVDSTMDSYN
jgi:hypothetical protein